jgi:hypothetical protein
MLRAPYWQSVRSNRTRALLSPNDQTTADLMAAALVPIEVRKAMLRSPSRGPLPPAGSLAFDSVTPLR